MTPQRCDVYEPLLQRPAQDLQHAAPELPQFIQEADAVVGKGVWPVTASPMRQEIAGE